MATITRIEVQQGESAETWHFRDSATLYVDYVSTHQTPTSDTMAVLFSTSGVNVRWEPKKPASRVSDLIKAKWFKPTVQAITILPRTTKTWATGSTPTRPETVSAMLNLLVHVLDHQVPPPSIVPTWEGGVQVEWHRNHVDLEIECTPSGHIEFFFKDRTDIEHEGLAWEETARLSEFARAVI